MTMSFGRKSRRIAALHTALPGSQYLRRNHTRVAQLPARSCQFCRNDRSKSHISLLSEPIMPYAAVTHNQNSGWCSLHPKSLHGDRDGCALSGFVNSDGKGQSVFMNESFE